MSVIKRDGVNFSRRTAVAGLGAFAAGCAAAPASPKRDPDARLAQHMAARDLAAVGLIVRRNGDLLYSGTAGMAAGLSPREQEAGVTPRAFLTSSKFRVASMTKSVVALTAVRLDRAAALSLDAAFNVEGGFALTHSDAPEAPITLARLLSHTSGVRDPDVYWRVGSGRIADLVTPDIYAPLNGAELGAYFEYANFNYGLAATLMERATGRRFDQLAAENVLIPMGLACGLNWSGVAPELRRKGATLYRRIDGDWTPQIDGPEMLSATEPSVLLNEGERLDDYVVGTNGTLFSPQGGLRASLEDLIDIAAEVQSTPDMLTPYWTRNAAGDNGVHDRDFFQSVGLGSVIFSADASPLPGRAIVGHHGEAYGLHGAYWCAPDEDIQIAYAAIGVPEVPAERAGHPTLNIYTAPLMGMAEDILG